MPRYPHLLFLFILLCGNAMAQTMNPTAVVSIPMRDGRSLAADVYVPDACVSCPAILIQTPYNKNMFRNGLPLGYLQNLQQSPYAWVVVDWRGFYASVSAAVAQPNRGEDGYDVIEWVTGQPWSDGRVGTWGPSALGVIQYQTAKEQHPAHICAVPLVAHPQNHYEGYFYGGALEKARLQTLDALGYGLSGLVMANVYHSPLWAFTENASWYPQSIAIPTLQIGGWYDHNIDRMMDWYKAVRTSAPTSVRDDQWLLVGPWVHGGTGAAYVGSAQQGALSYPDAAFKTDTMARAFFAHYLLDEDNGWPSTPKVTYYRTGLSGWGQSDASDIATAAITPLYLSDGGALQGQDGTGQTAFASDPRHPVPTIGGQNLHQSLAQGPYDQQPISGRDDVRGFATAPLVADFSITGRPVARIHLSCDRPDADLVVRLIDVYPDGREMLVNDGIRRLRFRNGFTQASEAFMQPGQTYSADVALPFVHYTFKEGHRIKALVSGSSAIRWDVNLQNGGTMYTAGDTSAAVITLLHNPQHPSQLRLPGANLALSADGREVSSTEDLSAFPNPTPGMLTLTSASGAEAHFNIIDGMGRTVMAGRMTDGRHDADLSSLPAGVYTIRLIDGTDWVRARRVVRL